MKFFVTFTSLYLTAIPLVLFPFVRQSFSANFFDLFALIFVTQSLIMIFEFGLTNVLVKLIGDVRKNIVETKKLYSFALVLCIYISFIGFLLIFIIALNDMFVFVPVTELKYDFLVCLVLIGCSRFLSAIPRIISYGYELFLGTSLLVIFLSSTRFLVPLALHYLDYIDEMSFFYTYLFLSLLEGILLWVHLAFKMELIKIPTPSLSAFTQSSYVFKKYWQTAIYTFIPSFMWLLSSQADKAFYILDEGVKGSGMLVAISGLASGILILTNSINSAFMPRLVSVESGSRGQRNNFFQMICIGLVILVLTMTTIMLFSHQLLIFWFQDTAIDLELAYLLQLYFIYFSILAASSYYYVYFFINDILKYHLITNIIYSLFVLIIWLTAADLNEYMLLMCANVFLCFVLSGLLLVRHKRKFRYIEHSKSLNA